MLSPAREPGIHSTAVVAADVEMGEGVSIGAHCVVERGARLGRNVVLMPGCYVGAGACLGDDTTLCPGVVLREECTVGDRCVVHANAVIGADGFGFALDAGRYHKIPQVGNVVIGNDVEIGANTTVDRATTHSTKIGDGSKLHNLIQIGHNVVMGEHCLVQAQVGISGSTELESHVTIGGQAGLIGHIRVGTGTQIGGNSGVTKSVPAGSKMSGLPAISITRFNRVKALLRRLPELWERTKHLEQRLDRLELSRMRERQEAR